MDIAFVNPFVEAAALVLSSEVGAEVSRGALSIRKPGSTTQDVNVILGVTGSICGSVLFGLTYQTAFAMVGVMIGEPVESYDDMVGSAIAEMGNVVTGRASVALEKSGFPCTISPPMLLIGSGATYSTPEIQLLVVPLETQYGTFEMGIALKKAAAPAVNQTRYMDSMR